MSLGTNESLSNFHVRMYIYIVSASVSFNSPSPGQKAPMPPVPDNRVLKDPDKR